jgi:NRAMP (natural resistance-associated macrophage protein)-like metal ion transporter
MNDSPISKALAYWKKLGPGLITGAADDDPSGIATYSQVGASHGAGLIWLSAVTFPIMAVIQEMCARIGMVTGKGIAANIRENFPHSFLVVCTVLLFIANTFNIGADLGAMAEATQLLFPNLNGSLLVIFFTVISLLLQIFTTYKSYARYLKWLTLTLFSYIAAAFAIDLDWSHILTSLVIPHMSLDRSTILLIAAILGTTISPYLFFWQSSQEVEEKEERKSEAPVGTVLSEKPTKEDMKIMRTDVWTGMFISNLVMFFIIAVCSGTLFSNGVTSINTAADAAAALLPFAGKGAYLLFALGIIGTGFLAVPVLAGSVSYAVSESMNWENGLSKKFEQAKYFYGVMIVAMLVGLALNFVGIDPIKALIYSAIANCIVAPVVLVFILLLSSSKKVMGDFVNSRLANYIGWFTAFIMAVVAVLTVLL